MNMNMKMSPQKHKIIGGFISWTKLKRLHKFSLLTVCSEALIS